MFALSIERCYEYNTSMYDLCPMHSIHHRMQCFSIVPPFDFSVGCKSYIEDRMYINFVTYLIISLVPWLTVYDGQRNIIYLCSYYVHES